MSDPLPPLSLYLHFPWCVAKCPYCDFNSHALRQGLPEALPEAEYVAALVRDLEAQSEGLGSRPVVSIFLGGGTPSLFSPAAIGRVLEAAHARLSVAPAAEVTLEANPGTIERGRFAEYRAAGITRVSLGAQSFGGAELAALGRIHDADDTRRAAAELHAAGLANFNLDLMYGLPGQSVAGALADVEAALDLAPAHLSHYQLTLEPGTRFGASPPRDLPPEEEVDAMLALAQARLGDAGLAQYEVSGYARAGARCRHNLNYWSFGDYLGVGAGAHGKLSVREDDRLRIERSTQPRDPRRYLASAGSGLVRTVVPPEDLPFEFMMNALRLVEGFSAGEWLERTGRPLEEVLPTLAALEREALVEAAVEAPVPGREARWRPTPRGLRFLYELLLRFLPPGGGSRESQGSARG